MKTKRVSSCAPGRITIQFVYENKIKDVIELCVKAAIYVADLAIMSMENKVRVAQSQKTSSFTEDNISFRCSTPAAHTE
ncbi:hypothetical protein RRG08_065888 [Elysia crispata]|uniref:Uncharacterized protein n=1 Tax=Elysia crispata TaxID=231223 RepID=A0AAE0YYC4_9GAST|nr:hypothetical protein RRG08_065888 [Elysia crispata]